MHGYSHVYVTEDAGIFPLNRFSEFAGLDVKAQEDKIVRVKEKLESKGIKSNIFMAPGHSFDDITIDVLRRHHFEYITDGFSKKPYCRSGITFIPIVPNIREAERKVLSAGIITLVVHTDTTNEALLERYKIICEMHKESLASYEEIMSLAVSEYDAEYEKWKLKNHHRMTRLYRMAKKIFGRKKAQYKIRRAQREGVFLL